METSLSDELANINPVIVVVVVMALTLVRLALARVREGWARTISETCDTVNFVLILAFLLIRPFAAQAFYIPSESMQNTLLVKDRLIVDKFSYRLHAPRADDVVVFVAPPEATENHADNVDFIKRLIGLPGDTIQVKAATLKIDGEPVDLGQDVHSYLRDRLGLTTDDSIKIFRDHILVDGKSESLQELAASLNRPGAKVEITPGETIRNGKVLDEPFTREDPDYNLAELTVPPGHFFMMGDNRNRSADSHIWGTLDGHRVIGRAACIFWPVGRIGAIR